MNIRCATTETAATASDGAATATLRLLGTTDLHANLLPYDYYTARDAQPFGLTRVATLIRAARAERPNTLLFDNGDALQGTPLADITLQEGGGWEGPHPVVCAMNMLGYDAATIGNHEFNFGLGWLTRALSDARFPLTCGNIEISDAADHTPALSRYLLLRREITDNTGTRRALTLGVLGLVPTQITKWDNAHLSGRLRATDMVECARALVPRMRSAGADIVLLLAHTGIDSGPHRREMENAALPLAAIPGVDAIMAGHSHEVFPPPDSAGTTRGGGGIDPARGTLNGTPTVMAGFRGSHLGVLDLDLEVQKGQWRLRDHRAEARPVACYDTGHPVPGDPVLEEALEAAHRATIHLVARPVGNSEVPLHSYLSQIGCNMCERLVTRAQAAALRRAVAGTPDAALPVLSASAPFKTGGRGGPGHYTDIPTGPLRLRHVADLYSFPNSLWGLRISGADLLDWLERAASCFCRVVPGIADQPLWNPAFPGHAFDVIDGLRYQIDLSAEARFDATGAARGPGPGRIRNLTFNGAPIAPDAAFLLATNSYRAQGGGPHKAWPAEAITFAGHVPIRDLLADHLQGCGPITTDEERLWTFVAQPPGTSALFETGPDLRRIEGAIAAVGATDLGDTKSGFIRLRLPL